MRKESFDHRVFKSRKNQKDQGFTFKTKNWYAAWSQGKFDWKSQKVRLIHQVTWKLACADLNIVGRALRKALIVRIRSYDQTKLMERRKEVFGNQTVKTWRKSLGFWFDS